MFGQSAPAITVASPDPHIDDDLRDRVYRFALTLSDDPHTAADLAQECMYRAYRQAPRMPPPERLPSWLFRTTRNLWRDYLRRERTRRRVTKELGLQCAGETTTADDQFEQQEELAQVLAAMQELPARQREVIFLRTVEQMSIREIASLLEMTRGTVKANLSLARKRMRKWLARHGVL